MTNVSMTDVRLHRYEVDGERLVEKKGLFGRGRELANPPPPPQAVSETWSRTVRKAPEEEKESFWMVHLGALMLGIGALGVGMIIVAMV